MNNNIILEGIKDATTSINNNSENLIDHATDQLFYMDDIIKNMGCEGVVLVNETYSRILMLEFETILLIKAIELNKPAIKINDSTLNVIKNNCDDILKKTQTIRTMQENRLSKLTQHDIQRVNNNESDIDLGAV